MRSWVEVLFRLLTVSLVIHRSQPFGGFLAYSKELHAKPSLLAGSRTL